MSAGPNACPGEWQRRHERGEPARRRHRESHRVTLVDERAVPQGEGAHDDRARLSGHRVNNADYLDWDAFAHALARHVQHRNGPDRDRRIAALERKLTIAA